MSQPVVPPFLPIAEPSLKDLLDAHKKDILLSTNCHAIATVFSFTPQDSGNGLAKITATMNYKKSFTVQQPNGGFVTQVQNYPALVDCPAIVLGGGPVSLQMPIASGDQCLILFNDRDLTTWWASPEGAASALPSSRLHSFSDAIALVGFKQWHIDDTIRALLTNGNAALGINPSNNKITIKNTDEGTLNTLLQNLINAVKAITVTTSVPSTPGNYTSGTPNNSGDLTAAANALAALLE